MSIKSKSGFTIIEVVLVLAIAGLIFLMVFVALPALQRSQRDTQRRRDMARVATAIVQYQADSGKSIGTDSSRYWSACQDGTFAISGCTTLPGAGTSNTLPEQVMNFIKNYLNEAGAGKNGFKDPNGSYYSMYIIKNVSNSSITSTSINDHKYGDSLPKMLVFDTDKATVNSPAEASIIYVFPGGKCDGEYATQAATNNFAILYRLEGSGVYCVDDQ